MLLLCRLAHCHSLQAAARPATCPLLPTCHPLVPRSPTTPLLLLPPQYVDEDQLEQMKASVGLLKKLLRQKAVAELKAYRKEMEVGLRGS